jgi:hypothetical protein
MALACAGQPHAEENGLVPYMAGVNIGIPAGAAPPPGFTLSDTTYYRPMRVMNGSGSPTPINVSLLGTSLSAVWVPGWQVAGGNYFAFVKQPFVWTTVEAPGSTERGSGNFNTIVSPGIVSWMVAPDLFVATGLTFYLKDGTYSKTAPVEVGNNFWTFEPSAAISYLGYGLNLTALAIYDIDTENTATNYQSGQVLSIDLTATKRFGAWAFGAGGYVAQQVTNDKVNGMVVPATPLNSAGNRVNAIAIGPTAGYDFGPVELFAYLTQDVQLKNTAGGTSFWLRLTARF